MVENTAKQSTLESLSALVDNQASELELHRLLKQSESDPEVRETWGRYQLSSAVMRGDFHASRYVDLSAGIRAAIDEEPAHDCDLSSAAEARNLENPSSRWWHVAGRFAVAASVAGAVMLGAQQYGDKLIGGASENEMAEAPAPTQSVPLPAGFNAPIPLNARTVSSHDQYQPNLREGRKVQFVPRSGNRELANTPAGREIQNHLNQLMLEHAEHAALNSGRGMLPFARVARMEEE